MKIKKCSKCGGNVPEGNTVCNNCGNSMSFFGGSSTIVSNYNKNSANTIPGGKPFDNNNKSSGCIIVFIALFFMFFIVSQIIDEMYLGDYQPENDSSFQDDFSDYYDEDDDYYDGNSSLESDCSIYCGENNFSSSINNKCYCSNGNVYDENGFLVNDYGNLDETYDNISYSINGWHNDVMSGKPVVSVVASSYCSYCMKYKTIIESLAKKYGFTLYYIYINEFSSSNEELFLYTFNLEGFEDSVPYTYVVNNKTFIEGKTGFMETYELESFLKNNGVI